METTYLLLALGLATVITAINAVVKMHARDREHEEELFAAGMERTYIEVAGKAHAIWSHAIHPEGNQVHLSAADMEHIINPTVRETELKKRLSDIHKIAAYKDFLEAHDVARICVISAEGYHTNESPVLGEAADYSSDEHRPALSPIGQAMANASSQAKAATTAQEEHPAAAQG